MSRTALYTNREHSYTVQITHWDYLYVNRQSGRAYRRWCRFQVLDGRLKGNFYEAAIPYFLTQYTPSESAL
jgi:hypothetical protein